MDAPDRRPVGRSSLIGGAFSIVLIDDALIAFVRRLPATEIKRVRTRLRLCHRHCHVHHHHHRRGRRRRHHHYHKHFTCPDGSDSNT